MQSGLLKGSETALQPACLQFTTWPCRQLETQRLQQVLAHPEFQANPLAAIKNHLAATLPEPAPPKAQSRQKKTLQQRRQHKEARQHASMDES